MVKHHCSPSQWTRVVQWQIQPCRSRIGLICGQEVRMPSLQLYDNLQLVPFMTLHNSLENDENAVRSWIVNTKHYRDQTNALSHIIIYNVIDLIFLLSCFGPSSSRGSYLFFLTSWHSVVDWASAGAPYSEVVSSSVLLHNTCTYKKLSILFSRSVFYAFHETDIYFCRTHHRNETFTMQTE